MAISRIGSSTPLTLTTFLIGSSSWSPPPTLRCRRP